MCSQCRAFITVKDKVCPYCQTAVAERAVDVRNPNPVAGLVPAQQFASSMILLVNIGLFIASALLSASREGGSLVSFDGQSLIQLGAKERLRVLYFGEWWRLLTAGFLHGGVLHIFMNAYGLMQLGPWVEETMGPGRLAILYVLTTIAGFYVSLFWTPAISIGASAAVFGLLGAMVGWGIRNRKTRQGQAVRSYFWHAAIYSLILSGFMPNIDNGAHLGGLVAGIALGYILDSPKLVTGWWERTVQGFAIVCVAATVASLVLIVTRLTGL